MREPKLTFFEWGGLFNRKQSNKKYVYKIFNVAISMTDRDINVLYQVFFVENFIWTIFYVHTLFLIFLIQNSFCVGIYKPRRYNRVEFPVAAVCSTQLINYRDIQIEIDETDNPDYYLSYWTEFDTSINVLSCSFYAIAFYIYYLVIPTRQIEDDCLLNLVGSMSIAHAALVYNNFVSDGVLPNACITNRKLPTFSIFIFHQFYKLVQT